MSEGKRRVLLVDDEQSILKTVGKRLELEGFEVLTAVDGQEALVKVQTECPDLVLLDLMLPILNGFDVCAALKVNERYRQIPVIIYTGRGEYGDHIRARDLGADAYVTKGQSLKALIEQIRTLLNRRADH